MDDFKLLIDGQRVAGDRQMDVINPANETVFSQCPVASPAQLDQAVAAAKRAFIGWSQTTLEQRRAKLYQVADAIHENIKRIAQVLTREQGKLLVQAEMEVGYSEIFCRSFAELNMADEVLQE